MRILVTGWRALNNYDLVRDTIEAQLPPSTPSDTVIIHGDYRGADKLADNWATINGVKVDRYPADWTGLGLSAGPIRNQQMIDEGKPDLVIAFPMLGESIGTLDLMRRATKAGITVIVVEVDRLSNQIAKQSRQP
jgi:YspA, cpYpsA-related SLOG family